MIEPYVLKPEEHPVFMAAMLNGITWGFKPNKDGVVDGEGYCMGDLNVHAIVAHLYTEDVLAIDIAYMTGVPTHSNPLGTATFFTQGTRSIKVG